MKKVIILITVFILVGCTEHNKNNKLIITEKNEHKDYTSKVPNYGPYPTNL